ncbi:hypothetical protein MJO28_001871 [Puccinia striiformis f. sp. tritici]|uniref:Uncharacterized protein n=1 Tax=Puccinia striiformis f. sp. tritici TaxID=168172 RepID=A0ACC0EVB2_9BASI|nr:hypothetical protein MJO28_001871 [Puccinia striiformis f. sp. tritici]
MPLTGLTSTTSNSVGSSSAVLQHIQAHRDTPVEQLFTKLDIVGKGAYGAVYKGIHIATQTVLALKVINLDTAEDDIIEIQREVALLSQLRDSDKHNCIGYHGCHFYQTELWIAMDFASGGSIRTLLKPGKIDEKYTQLIIRETLIGLNYLHRQEIIHRDIKSANILLTNSNRVLLCDFGIAAPLQTTNHKRSTFIGTPYWMAPEVITDGKLYDTKADIWSLGITLYEMLNGNPPFSDLTPAKVILKIPRSQPAKLEGNQFSNSVKEFLAACLIDEPNDRPTAEDLCKQKWIKSISKAPLSPLKDLTTRYSRWINSGGVRQSLADISISDQTNPGRESPPLDKADWDFMEDHSELDSYKMDGINSIDPDDQSIDPSSKDGAVTLRPHQAAASTAVTPMRQARPHRLMKLFEDDSNDNNGAAMFNKFNFQQHSYSNPISPANNNSFGNSGPSTPPIVGLGFPVPGMIGVNPTNELRMELPTPPTISIPTTEEFDQFLEPPTYHGDPTNPNRPFSPSSSSYNRSITPTPSRLKQAPSSTLSGKSKVDGLNTTPLLPSPPLGPDTHNNSSKLFARGASPPPLPTSPSLPLVSSETNKSNPSSSSSRNRANTTPLIIDGNRLAMNPNSPALPSPMLNNNCSNFSSSAGGNGKQFAGNGFSFGGPSSSTTSSHPPPLTLLTGSNNHESNHSFTNQQNHGGTSHYNPPSHQITTERERSHTTNNHIKTSVTSNSSHHNGSSSSYTNPNGNGNNNLSTSMMSVTSSASNFRSRSTGESSSRGELMINKISNNNSSLSSSVSSMTSSNNNQAPHVPFPSGMTSTHQANSSSNSTRAILSGSSTSTSTSTTNHQVQLIPNWPTGDKIQVHKDLAYRELTNVKDVKIQLDYNCNLLRSWLDTCDQGLGLLIDSLK